MADDLKPCPHCSGKPFLECEVEELTIARVICTACGACGPYVDLADYRSQSDAEAEAARLWNDRPALSLPSREDIATEVYKTLRNWRLSTIAQEDEPSEGYPLVDAVSTPGGTIDTGETELGEIAAEVTRTILSLIAGAKS